MNSQTALTVFGITKDSKMTINILEHGGQSQQKIKNVIVID